jgi:acetyl esterase/lipase
VAISDDILTRPAPPPDLTVAYGPHPDQVADIRLPAAGTPTRPTVVIVHGGFWKPHYDRSHTGPLGTGLVSRGHPVVSLEYRRIGEPAGGWPAAGDDVLAGLAAVPDLVAAAVAAMGREPVDTDRPILAGHSAGGQLVLYAGRLAGPTAVRGVVALAPVADLIEGHRLNLGRGAVAQLLGGSPEELPDVYAQADPTVNLPVGVRTVVVHGDFDENVPVALGVDFADAARAAGDDVRLIRLPAAEHFALIDPLADEWPEILAAIDHLA